MLLTKKTSYIVLILHILKTYDVILRSIYSLFNISLLGNLSGISLLANGGDAIVISVHPEIHSLTHLNLQKLNFLLVYRIQVKSFSCVEKNNFAFKTTNKRVFEKLFINSGIESAISYT